MTDQPRTVPSAEFRRIYPRLTTTTTVTVSGHILGTWIPASVHLPISTMTDARTIDATRPGQAAPSWNPAPKPSAKR